MKKFNLKKLLKWIAVASIFILLILSVVFRKKDSSPGPISAPTPISVSTISAEDIYESNSPIAPPKPYLLNETKSREPVLGYGWIRSNLIYATNTGIYNSSDNTSVLSENISYIQIREGIALVKSTNTWVLLNINTKQRNQLTIPLEVTEISLHPQGTHVAYYFDKRLNVVEVSTFESKGIDISKIANETKIFWDIATQKIILSQILANSTTVTEYDMNLEITNTTDYSGESTLIAVSSFNGLLAFRQQDRIRIFHNGTESNSYSFPNTEEIKGTWITERELIVHQKVKADNLGRKIDYIWKLGIGVNPQFMIDSRPIQKRLATIQPFIPDPSNTFVPLIENSGSLWLLGLRPGEFPIYSADGIDSRELPGDKKQDEH